jgi:hypothetical protein
MTRGAIVVLAAIVVGGCGGGEEQEQVFRPADAMRIANVRPVMPGWTWPQNSEKPVASGSQTEDPSTNPHLLNLVERAERGSRLPQRGRHKWRDDTKLANLYANVLASAAEAHELMAPFNAYSRGWGESSGRITKDEEIDDLGDEAWLLRTEKEVIDYESGRTKRGTEVTYHWRRGNLVVEAHVDCFGVCPGDVDAAARAWVDAIDEAARAGS